MKPLKTSQWMLSLVFITPSENPLGKWELRIYIAANALCVLCVIGYFVSSVITLMNIVSTDLETALYPLGQALGSGACLNIIVVVFFLRRKICEIFTRLPQIYKNYEDEDSFRYLVQANNKSEWAWKIYIKCSILVVVSFPIVSICSIFICWFEHGQFDAKHVFHASKLTLPWNHETLIGYIVETGYCAIVCGVYYFLNGAVLMLFVSLTWILQSFSKICRHTAKKFENSNENRNDEETLRKLIDFQNMAREFFMQLMPVFNPLIMIQLICNMLFLAVAAFRLYLQHKNVDLEMYAFGLCALSALSILFLYCYFGKMASDSFTDMADCLYEMDWHEFPIKLQKYIILMIQNAQRPLYYRGFGMITLNLETFCELIQGTYSYLMIFITLTTN